VLIVAEEVVDDSFKGMIIWTRWEVEEEDLLVDSA
jgi:hypothetical protein